MRDTHKLKEKVELSLDNRQIVSITVASLVVLGGVFMLGVVVGKKLAGEVAEARPAVDLLTQLDEKSKALEQMQADASDLTFQDELTKKSPTLIAGAPVVKPIEAPKPAEPVKPAEPPKPAEPTAVPLAAAPLPESPLPVALPETPKAEPVPTRTHDGGALREAFGKAQKVPETAADGAWSIQLAAYQDRAEADRFAAGLRDKGYAPYIIEAAIPGKGTWFRVRMGRFASKDAAGRYLEDFQRETSMNAIVTAAN
ncbi:MAG: SPOR domain-containing protein [Myxococcota bacterium]|jgi:cell division protein FtsN